MEGALPVEVVRACREVVLGRRCRPVEDDSVGVLEPARRGTALWLSEDNGGLLTDDLLLSEDGGSLLTDGLLLSELSGGLVVTDRGGRIEPSLATDWELELNGGLVATDRGGRMEPSPGCEPAGAARCDKLPVRVSRDVEELELGGLIGSLLGDWLLVLVGSTRSPPPRLLPPGASGACSLFNPFNLDFRSIPAFGFRMERVRLGSGAVAIVLLHSWAFVYLLLL